MTTLLYWDAKKCFLVADETIIEIRGSFIPRNSENLRKCDTRQTQKSLKVGTEKSVCLIHFMTLKYKQQY